MPKFNFWDDVEEFERRKLAHKRPYGDITGEQSFMTRALKAWKLDTGVGQVVSNLEKHFEHDAVGESEDWGFNPYIHADLTGYENHLDSFLSATSLKEVEINKEMVDENMAIRDDLDGNWGARLMGNVLDPINLVPIPLAKGIGFVKGAYRGSVGVTVPFAVSEGVRAEIDPTNPWYEPVFAVGGGALFGGAFGGTLGMWKKGDWDNISKAWFEMDQAAIDSSNKIVDAPGYHKDNINVKPLQNERAKNQTEAEHLRDIVHRQVGETDKEFITRLDKIVSDGLYDDFVNISRSYNPEQFMPTFTGIEKMRWSQHPFFLLVNNKFQGAFGSDLSALANRIAGSPGLITKGAANLSDHTGKTMQGVYNRMKIHDVHVIETRNELFNAFKGSQGRPETAGDLTAGQQVFQSMSDLVTGKYKAYEEYLDKVSRAYLTGRRNTGDQFIDRGTKALAKYYNKMGELGQEVGVFGKAKVTQEVVTLEKILGNNRTFLKTFLEGDPLSKNRAYAMGAEARTAKQAESLQAKRDKLSAIDESAELKLMEAQQRIDTLIEQGAVETLNEARRALDKLILKRGLTNKQAKLRKTLDREIFNLEKSLGDEMSNLKAIREYLANPEEFMRIHGDTPPPSGEMFNRIFERHRKLNNSRQLQENWGKAVSEGGTIPRADKAAIEHFPRMWKRDVVIQHREELRKILIDHYSKQGNVGQRAEETIDAILKERKPALVKRALREGLEEVGANESTILRMEKKVDDIFTMKKSRGETVLVHQENQINKLARLMDGYMKEYGFGDSINFNVATALERIENMASAGTPEGFGAATSLMPRRLDIPSYKLIKGEGQTDSVATVDFIELNPEVVMRNYHRRMSSSIEMAREVGDPNMAGELARIQDHILTLASRAKNKKEADAIRAEGALQVQAIKDLSEKALGVYKLPQDPSSIGQRGFRLTKNWMVLALMGQAGIAALADLGRGVMSVGIKNAFGSMLVRFGEGASEFTTAGKQIQEQFGEAGEIALHGRFQMMFDVDSYALGNTWAEKFFQGGVNKMFIMNVLAPWTDMMKRFYGSLIVSDMSKMAIKWAGDAKLVSQSSKEFGDTVVIEGAVGTLTKAEAEFMRRNGINLEDAIVIAEQLKLHGDQGQHLHLANVDSWADKELARTFKTAAITEINNAVITPGIAEKLNFMSTPAGSLMTQFKSFAMSATHRTLLSGLQQRDARVVSGIMATVAMGYVVDLIKSPSYDPRDLTSLDRLIQAVDYSGTTGMLFDVNNMLEFATAHREDIPHLGIRPLFGVDSPWISDTKIPSWAQRIGQPGGPAVSLFGDLAYSMFDPDAQGSDAVRSMRRLIPFNNLLYVDWLFDRLQRNLQLSIDRPPSVM